MRFNSLTATHITDLNAMVSDDRFSTGESVLKLHAKDQSHHRGCQPEAVIWPQDTAEVVAILQYANAHHLPAVGWGSGSSLEGNPIPVQKGLVLDFTQMNRILDVREEDFQVDVEPGVVYQDLNEHLKNTGLFFPPDPGARATVGGMIANNASGTRTVYYGSTKDYVLKLKVVLASGEILEFHGPSLAYLSEIMGMAEEICKENGSLAFKPGLGREQRNRMFEARHELGEMITRAHPNCRVQVIDVAVPITGYPDIIATARQKADDAGIPGYAFSHAGDGNLHLCLAGRKEEAGDWERINHISQHLVSKAIAMGGTATGEHGVGIGKRKYMPDEHGNSLEWMKRIKSLFDPNGILNPGKIFP